MHILLHTSPAGLIQREKGLERSHPFAFPSSCNLPPLYLGSLRVFQEEVDADIPEGEQSETRVQEEPIPSPPLPSFSKDPMKLQSFNLVSSIVNFR